jgi:hypothetical protein
VLDSYHEIIYLDELSVLTSNGFILFLTVSNSRMIW